MLPKQSESILDIHEGQKQVKISSLWNKDTNQIMLVSFGLRINS